LCQYFSIRISFLQCKERDQRLGMAWAGLGVPGDGAEVGEVSDGILTFWGMPMREAEFSMAEVPFKYSPCSRFPSNYM
jgi:hypothetical protein